MNRFRHNFVFKGSSAKAEDSWRKIIIGSSLFHIVKPCGRCGVVDDVITTSQENEIRDGKELLKPLSAFRLRNRKIIFGQNLIGGIDKGNLRLGDRVNIIESLTLPGGKPLFGFAKKIGRKIKPAPMCLARLR